MNWNEIGNAVFQLVLIPLILLAAKYLKQWINLKIEDLKAHTNNDTLDRYLDMLNQTIIDCVT